MHACPVFIGGEWRRLRGAATPVFNPSTGEVIAECPAGDAARWMQRCRPPHAAFPAWRDTPAGRARARLFPLPPAARAKLRPHLSHRSRASTARRSSEARGSVFRGLENVEYACGIPSLLMGDTLENIARGVDCETMLQPLGVCVGHHAVQFSRDGAAVDVSDRAGLRKHVRAEAERESAAHRRAARRTARAGRPAQRRVQHRPRRARSASMRCSRIRR